MDNLRPLIGAERYIQIHESVRIGEEALRNARTSKRTVKPIAGNEPCLNRWVSRGGILAA